MANVLLDMKRAATVEVVGDVNVRRVVAVLTFTILTTLGAFVQVRLPGIPVPITLQTLFVSLSGVLLGAQLGALSQALYIMAGAAGLPVFAGGMGIAYLLGPTGGYLIAFPLAAYVTGVLAGRVPMQPGMQSTARLAVAIFLGTLVVFAGGAAQLAVLTGDAQTAVRLGVLPFVAGDIVKVVLAVLIARRLRRRISGLL